MQVKHHWDKLKVCVVGSAYPPEFYSFVENKNIRGNLEIIAKETCEDLNNLQRLLESFDVNVIRPKLPDNAKQVTYGNKILPAPLTVRDHFGVIEDILFMPTPDALGVWRRLQGADWPDSPPQNIIEFDGHSIESLYNYDHSWMKELPLDYKKVVYDKNVDTAMVQRLGNVLLCGNWAPKDPHVSKFLKKQFPNKNVILLETEGHLDGTLCCVSPELAFVTPHIEHDVFTKNMQVYTVKRNLNNLVNKTKLTLNSWWLPENLQDHVFEQYIDTYFNHWLGDIQETYLDVNMLIIDPSNIIISNYNEQVFRVLEEHGITAHVSPFRHQLFWDSGIHCLTNDLDRQC